jgi:Leucine-rich repeat (LRR) protein
MNYNLYLKKKHLKNSVNSFCLVYQKKKHSGSVKDFTHDLNEIEKITLPLIDCEIEDGHSVTFMKISSIDKNSFIDLPRLTSLHLKLAKSVIIDLSYMINLKELFLETEYEYFYEFYDESDESDFTDPIVYLNLSLPKELEKLRIFYFDTKLNSLDNLRNLKSLELNGMRSLLIEESTFFDRFENLKYLNIKRCGLNFEGQCGKRIKFGSNSLEELYFDVKCSVWEKSSIYFGSLSKLRKLHLTTETIDNIDFDSFKKLSYIEDLEVLMNSIEHEKELIESFNCFKRLNKLSTNGISSLKEKTLKTLSNFVNLKLRNLDDIHSLTFVHANKLVDLDLSTNELKQIDASLFNNLINLETLDLSGNPLGRIDSLLFKNLTQLKKLHLNNCGLVEIHANQFRTLDNLIELKLGSTKLTKIKPGTFSNNVLLEKLYLESSELAEIKQGTFDSLQNLKHLRLWCRKLAQLDGNVFINLKKLERLNLAGSSLTKIEAGLFEKLNKLKWLSMNAGKLEKIDETTFASLCDLEELNLGYNRLREIPVGAFDQMKKLKYLALSE